MTILTVPQLQDALIDIPNWEHVHEKLTRSFEFKDFSEAISFMNKVAAIAEELNHHPEIWNSYNKVILSLTTHEAEGITEKDVALAKRIDSM